ncbi:phospholipase A1-like isoform X2 [Leguminivora glycinivorella]|uniref:phospholipase A1-like isoform X2 n=1 Tax=Leguminivora glycinivorella TaxID=1035111 RepID=UPI00200F2F9E|nr:phospholipase A1-like isoform X2 [Leguminivora glycinivorella]
MALVPLAVLAVAAVGVASSIPRPQYGYSAGFLPHCPGIMTNSSISERSMPKLQVVHHQLINGQVTRRSMPVLSAPRMLAKSKRMDFTNKKTVLYAVGFLDSAVWPHTQAVGTAYAKRGYNVFITETFSFLTYIYPKSVRLTRVIGQKMGEFLVKLTEQGLSPDNLELVGLSLGAHIVSYAAKHFYNATGKKPSRLTGLDPSGPCFKTMPLEHRLNPSDAEHIEIVHTNIDGFGTPEPLGHVDFYANGGEYQPSDIPYIPCLVVCSHLKSVFYWWQALEHPNKFIGQKCDSVQAARYNECNSTETNVVGLETDFSKPGIYYLSTSNEFPYYRGKEALKGTDISANFVEKLNEEEFVA